MPLNPFHSDPPAIPGNNALKKEEVDFVVQVNGKLRAQFTAGHETENAILIERAKEEASAFVEGKILKKAIVVPHRQLINLVVGE